MYITQKYCRRAQRALHSSIFKNLTVVRKSHELKPFWELQNFEIQKDVARIFYKAHNSEPKLKMFALKEKKRDDILIYS